MKPVEARCREILSEVLLIPIDRLDARKTLTAFGIDSVKMMEILIALEAEYGELPLEKVLVCQRLEELVAIVESGRPAATL